MKDFVKKLMDRLSVCLTYAGEDIDDFLWVLEEDEREGRAPANVEKMREIYRQIKDQYSQDSETLRRGMDTADALDLAVHMVELYQAMFDYLMADDPSAGVSADPSAPGVSLDPGGSLGPGDPSGSSRSADFNAMYELFKKNKDLPS